MKTYVQILYISWVVSPIIHLLKYKAFGIWKNLVTKIVLNESNNINLKSLMVNER